MDQGFTKVKLTCDASTVHVAAKKMAACVAARKKMKAKQQSSDGDSSHNDAKLSHVADLEEFSKEGDADGGDIYDDFEFSVKGSVCSVKIDNNDLSTHMNGCPDDPIELRPFDSIFTQANI